MDGGGNLRKSPAIGLQRMEKKGSESDCERRTRSGTLAGEDRFLVKRDERIFVVCFREARGRPPPTDKSDAHDDGGTIPAISRARGTQFSHQSLQIITDTALSTLALPQPSLFYTFCVCRSCFSNYSTVHVCISCTTLIKLDIVSREAS